MQLGSRQRESLGLAANEMGQALRPIALGTDRTAQKLVAGGEFACALLDNGSIKCWGDNIDGQLGQGEGWITYGTARNHMGDELSPIAIPGVDRWVDVAAGTAHACGVSASGGVYCWGQNEQGQLGQNDRIARGRTPDSLLELRPINLINALRASQITAGHQHSCALLASKRIVCWGDNESGQLAQGDLFERGADRRGAIAGVAPIDFGRNCALCESDRTCDNEAQCASGICREGTCRTPGCNDAILNGDESDVDCGGVECRSCAFGGRCRDGADCISRSCAIDGPDLGICQSATCVDGIQNGQETDIDCGGPRCEPCTDQRHCEADDDCASGHCFDGLCISCNDGILNGDEVDVDCGGLRCVLCADGRRCNLGTDCLAGQCEDGLCISCEDGAQNGEEISTDCGGPFCAGCPDGTACNDLVDCASRQCEDGRCISCEDGIFNGAETDLDCGGPSCAGCAPRQACGVAFDCASRVCLDGRCQTPTCFDGIENGSEGDADCGSLQTVVYSVAPGTEHTCFLLSGGRVKCLGRNNDGQLGQGDSRDRSAPEQLGDALSFVDLPDDVTALFSGTDHSCGITQSGRVFCWGSNTFGQLGIGLVGDRGDAPEHLGPEMRPTLLPDGLTVTDLCLGSQHTCALGIDGSVRCWGANGRGQLGYADRLGRGGSAETMGDALGAVDLGQGAIATDVVCGKLHTCARLTSGQVKCWGDSRFGQLGLGTEFPVGDEANEMGDELPALDLGMNLLANAIEAGENHNCALLTDGTVKCWGSNLHSALGIDSDDHRGDAPGEMGDALPRVPLPRPAAMLAAGANATCVLLATRELHCWGANLQWGTVGIEEAAPSIPYRGVDHPEVELERYPLEVKTIAQHVCAILEDNSVRCWGRNDHGQLGLGDRRARGRANGDMGPALMAPQLGRSCPGCAIGAQCAEGPQCESGVCIDNVCGGIGCADGVRNGLETDIDCGGPECPTCRPSQTCAEDTDCRDEVCLRGQCSTCGDRAQNGDETDVDCGGPECGPCPNDSACAENQDCVSNACAARVDGRVCVERSCEDGIVNGTETDVDCGGEDCAPCPDGLRCSVLGDCSSDRCDAGLCTSCTDAIRNGDESDIDCGGVCGPCPALRQCQDGTDCASQRCSGGICQFSHCADGLQNGSESDVDCGGTSPVIQVIAGADRTCVRFADQRVKCFGENGSGALGIGDLNDRGASNDLGDALPYLGIPRVSSKTSRSASVTSVA